MIPLPVKYSQPTEAFHALMANASNIAKNFSASVYPLVLEDLLYSPLVFQIICLGICRCDPRALPRNWHLPENASIPKNIWDKISGTRLPVGTRPPHGFGSVSSSQRSCCQVRIFPPEYTHSSLSTINSRDDKDIKKYTTAAYRTQALQLAKTFRHKTNKGRIIWQMHRTISPVQILSLRAMEGYLAPDPPKLGNRLMVHALIKFDTEQVRKHLKLYLTSSYTTSFDRAWKCITHRAIRSTLS